MPHPILLLAIASAAVQDTSCLNRSARPGAGHAFVDVNVIPMDRERVLLSRTVLVTGCRITAIGHRDSVQVPTGYTRIQAGDDLFLMPGLVDAHTHLRYDNDIELYLTGGVTTVRNMSGDDRHITWKQHVRSGGFGPRIITAPGTPYDNQWSADRIRAFVDSVRTRGFDFLKVFDGTPAPVYRALVEHGRRAGLPIAGHIPTQVGFDSVLATGQRTIEHAEQIVYRRFGADYDATRIGAVVNQLKASGVGLTPTLSVIQSWVAVVDSPTVLVMRPETRWLHPETYAYWHTFSRASSFENRMLERFQRRLVKDMSDAGVPILAGTDALMVGLMGPWGLLRELRALQDAGLSSYDVLRSATSTPATVLGYKAGVIVPGNLADLILVRGNPLEDLNALSKLEGVMMDGVWHPAVELERRQSRIANAYRSGNEFVRLSLRGALGEGLALQRALRQAGDSSRLDATMIAYVASILRQRGRNDEALRVYDLALEESPGSAAVHEGIARTHLAAGRVTEAIAALNRALQEAPNRQSARNLLALLRPPPTPPR
jgi:imidazolonepropionase-like amidohydrolase